MAMDPLSGAGHRDPRNAATGAGEALGLRSGAVVVLTADGADAPGFWRLSSGGTSLVARADGALRLGVAYRVLVEPGREGGLAFRVLGPAGLAAPPPRAELPGPAGPSAEMASRAGLGQLAALPPAAAAALLALVREGLPLARLAQLGRLAGRSGDAEEAAGLAARALAEDPDASESDLQGILDRVLGAGGAAGERGGADSNGGGGDGREGRREGGQEPDAPGLEDAGVLDEREFGRFLGERALAGVEAREARGRWAYHSFAFTLDGVALSGVMRILVPERPGGDGAIAASLRAGQAGRRWRFRLDFGGSRPPRLVAGRGISGDRGLARELAAFGSASGLADLRVLEPGEDLDGATLPPGMDAHA